jgi:hypothetical protein
LELQRQFTDVRTPFSMMAVSATVSGLPSNHVYVSLDLVRIAELKINLANGTARSKVATRLS